MNAHADIGQILLNAARAAPRLDADEERDLISAYRFGDFVALGRLVISNVRLALATARRLRGYGLPADDLVQEGIIGLIEAAARFDVDREIRFSTYAMWWIKSSAMDFVLRNWSMVRTAIGSDQEKLFFKLRGLKAKLLRDPSMDPSQVHAAIAAALGVSVRDVEVMDLRLAVGDVHLNAPAPWDEDGVAEIGDSFADPSTLQDETVTSFLDDGDREGALRKALADLDERERLVVQERWLTEDVAPLEALGEFLGITAGRVKKIEIAAIAKLQLLVGGRQLAAA